MQEAGVKGYDFSTWFAVLAPAGTSREIVQRINRAIGDVVRSKEMSERFAREGFEAFMSTPEATGAFIGTESANYARLIKSRGITAE